MMKLLIASVLQHPSLAPQALLAYSIAQSDLASPYKVHHPVICEGSGKRIIGPNAQIGKEAEVSVGKEGILTIGANLRLGKGAVLRLGNNNQLSIGQDFKMEYGSACTFRMTGASAMSSNRNALCHFLPRRRSCGQGPNRRWHHIGDHSIIDCAANVIIGKEVAIGPNCVLYSHDHDYTSESSAAWKGG